MKQKQQNLPSLVGSGALLTVLAVLCLTALTLLSLTSARRERQLSDASAQTARDYYAADADAQAVFARLRLGEQVPGVTREGGQYRYQCAISDTQTLEVTLEQTETGWAVLRWQAVPREFQIDEHISVWNEGKEQP